MKQKWDSTIYLLDWLKSKNLTIPIDSKYAEQQELSFIAGRNKNDKATSQDKLAVS